MDTALYDAINNEFVDAYSSAKGFLELGAFSTAARAVGMIGATTYIFSRLWGPLASGEPINFFPLMRPFVLLVAIIFSNPICNSLNRIFEEVDRISTLDLHMRNARNKIDVALIQREKNYLIQVQRREKIQSEKYINAFMDADGTVNWAAATSPVETAGGVFMQNMAEDAMDGLQEMLTRMMVFIFDGAGLVGYFLITLISMFLTSILQFVAPLAFAFAIFDGFSNNATEWFGKFINAKLMILLCKAYTIFTYYFEVTFIEKSLEWETGRTALYIIVVIVCLVGYFFIPTMANMALSVGGMGPTATTSGQRTIALKNLAVNTAMAPVKALGKLF